MMADADQSNLTMLTVDLLSAFVANNNVEYSVIPELIRSTYAALKSIDTVEPAGPEEPEHKPAVTVRKSLASNTHIISLIDGKPYKTLRRHLAGHGLTPEEYRERFGLPKTYPMVSKAYSDSRRAIAEKLGLGRRVKGGQAQAAAPAPTQAADTAPPVAPAPAKTPVAKAPKAAAKAKAVPTPAAKPKTLAKAKAPAAAKAEAPAASEAPAKAAPKARKASAPKPALAPAADIVAKPAPRKRATKAATAAS
jgi:predicted transcriptional regulator